MSILMKEIQEKVESKERKWESIVERIQIIQKEREGEKAQLEVENMMDELEEVKQRMRMFEKTFNITCKEEFEQVKRGCKEEEDVIKRVNDLKQNSTWINCIFTIDLTKIEERVFAESLAKLNKRIPEIHQLSIKLGSANDTLVNEFFPECFPSSVKSLILSSDSQKCELKSFYPGVESLRSIKEQIKFSKWTFKISHSIYLILKYCSNLSTVEFSGCHFMPKGNYVINPVSNGSINCIYFFNCNMGASPESSPIIGALIDTGIIKNLKRISICECSFGPTELYTYLKGKGEVNVEVDSSYSKEL